jgi:hypothetical protein
MGADEVPILRPPGGKTMDRKRANATETAAMVPDWKTVKNDQP